ncbi:hypothetical protein KSP39_PZI019020 [Platanthera zijinensis]|uniref:Uncharacterized protein n=1 Tax=Platanthera zijinensis TaxID=2320716 RepID=A0AAP0B2R7_9ASPA
MVRPAAPVRSFVAAGDCATMDTSLNSIACSPASIECHLIFQDDVLASLSAFLQELLQPRANRQFQSAEITAGAVGAAPPASPSTAAAAARNLIVGGVDPSAVVVRRRRPAPILAPAAHDVSSSSADLPAQGFVATLHSSEKSKDSNQENSLDADLKRKQPLEESETPALNKFQKSETPVSSKKPPSHHPSSSNSQNKREKMDWNLLRRQEAQKKRT